ncbi:hypothetical protein Mag101_11835 [Microbulbifer agarilyticus]|uniref:Orotate phosphoribosyltransferase n=1 Tax=Microbulbifer agarilyticus TaxID=260552 RepID=A0A1Q2M684_9GAMM|nr:DUF4870 domain-containing protein [Microbulbifer agarilyticus]AQQ68253.1 hypothetical protein Mag101_11835 [Microbulbifer agarilyticus]
MDEFKPWGLEKNTYLMLMHLSQLVGFCVPGAGLILPIIMWAVNKDNSPEIDRHGKVILNWMISALIYSVILIFLMIIVIGVFGFLILLLLDIIFVVVGAINASEGKLWKYPLSIQFFKVEEA